MSLSVEESRMAHGPRWAPAAGTLGEDRLRLAAYWMVAIAAFIAGFMVSRSAERENSGSRVEWPAPSPGKPHPRSLGP
jgi:hypothetical protein